MRKPLKRLADIFNARKGLFILVAAVFITVGVSRVTADGIPFFGGSGQSHVSFTELTKDNFQSEIGKINGKAIFVELGDGSADAQAQQVVLDQAVDQFGSKVVFFRVNTKTNPQVAQIFTGVVAGFLQEQGMTAPKTFPSPLHLLITIDAEGTPKVLNLGAGLVPTKEIQTFVEDGLSGKALEPPAQTTPTPGAGSTSPAPTTTPGGTTAPATADPAATPKSGEGK